MKNKTKIGIIGCGNISGIYCQAPSKLHNIEIAACADIDPARAKSKAEEYQIPKALTVAELLKDPENAIVLNLTPPASHALVAKAALKAGTSVSNEKPLSTTREDARALMKLAAQKGLRIGCAPDTFLGGGLQTCRKLIDDGWIGTPVAAAAFLKHHGPDSWHPNPEFFYQFGGGPMFDMGPYYLTALTVILGPVVRVCGSARASFPHRTLMAPHRYGEKIPVEVPTHIAGVLDFASGVVGTITTSFDVWSHRLPFLEIYGSEGTLSLPDPNTFGGPVLVRRSGVKEWSEAPLTHGYIENSRGLGVADMAAAIKSKRPHRANAETAYHVLDIMHSIHDASEQGKYINLKSTMKRPEPLPMGLLPGRVEL
ncbi:MAG TPA: Gfo/Idh/MocA family oxidoreductase [Chthoniobacteraceae bacterium]|nr:Gfo/Idh/MocA family oxidoreductase [Chthoniobacteraceae bacterium]